MKIFIGICFFILLSLVGCGDKKGKEVSEVPVIRLDPDHVDTLKVSDYFSHIDGFVLRDSIFYNIQGFQEFPDKYIMVAADNADLIRRKRRIYVFDKEGDFQQTLGAVGRGPGEHLGVHNGLQLTDDSVLHVLDNTKYLRYSLNGEVLHEELWLPASVRLRSPGTPIYVWRDSLIVLSTSDARSGSRKMIRWHKRGADTTHIFDIYSLKNQRIIHSFFPRKEYADLILCNALYEYKDTLCFYYDKDRIIYQLSTDRAEVRYRLDKGKYDRLQTREEFMQVQGKEVPYRRIDFEHCNETDKYVIGSYYFKGKFYIFIYDKETEITKNYRWVNNDLLGTGTEGGIRWFNWNYGLCFKQDYLWMIAIDWIKVMGIVKGRSTAEEWERYCEEHPDFIRYYNELLRDREDEEGWDTEVGSKLFILKYYFK